MRIRSLGFVTALATALLGTPTAGAFPHRQAVPPETDSLEQIEQFLRTARVVEMKGFPPGNTQLQKVTLTQGDTVHHAAFRSAGSAPHLKNSWMLEIAAYEIDKLLGLDMVPPTVERAIRGTAGSLQFWIENAISESDRREKKIDPPDVEAWRRQFWKVRVFDCLVSNVDRSPHNVLYDKNWKLYLCDHDWAFKVAPDPGPWNMTHFSVSMMEALERLDRVKLTRSCSDYLSGPQIDTVLSRRDQILEAYRQAVTEKGTSVIYP